MNGKNVKHVDDGKTDKKLVLTESKKEEKVNEAIESGAVINVPSNEVVSKMEQSYDNTEKSGDENGFIAGQNGTTSRIVSGDKGHISSSDWAPAQADILNQNDLKLFDAHSHPNTTDENGNFTEIGTPKPSPTDISNASSTHPDAVLGYKQSVEPQPSGQIGGSSTVKTERYIGFYNAKGNLTGEGIKFSDFKSTVSKINKQ